MSARSKSRMPSRSTSAIVVALLSLFLFLASTLALGSEQQNTAPQTSKDATVKSVKNAGGTLNLDFSRHFPDWAKEKAFGLALWRYAVAFFFILLGFVAKKVSDFLLEKKLLPLLKKTRLTFDSVLAAAARKPLGFLFLLGGVYIAFGVLTPAESGTRTFMFNALKVLVAIDILWFLFRAIDAAVEALGKLASRTESKLDDQLIPLIRRSLKATIAVICFLWVVQLLGLKISSLLAGLGIGGLAVALALQDTLSNVFGSVFIFIDRPFGVKDWIKIGDVEGVVEDIGFRSTRIRTWPATLVSIPNKTVAAATIDNWSRMPKRRVKQIVGVTYETSPEQMEQAVASIRSIVENDEGVDKGFIVIRFDGFGDSSLNILLYYFTRAVGLADHLLVKERINLAIMRALRDLGLSIAFPTRTVYFEGQVARDLAGPGPVFRQKPVQQ